MRRHVESVQLAVTGKTFFDLRGEEREKINEFSIGGSGIAKWNAFTESAVKDHKLFRNTAEHERISVGLIDDVLGDGGKRETFGGSRADTECENLGVDRGRVETSVNGVVDREFRFIFQGMTQTFQRGKEHSAD